MASTGRHGAEQGERTTSSLGVWPWAQLAVRSGMSLPRFCELAGVRVSALRDPEVRFSQADANRVAALAFARFGAGAALEAALMIEAGHFNLLEMIARSAPTVSDGLQQGCRFFPLLHDGGQLAFEALEAGAIALRWHPPGGYEVHHGYVELAFAVAVLGIRREVGDLAIAPAELCFRHEGAGDCTRYQQVLGAEARFAAHGDWLAFDAQVASRPLARGSTLVHTEATRAAAELLDDDATQPVPAFARRVKRA